MLLGGHEVGDGGVDVELVVDDFAFAVVDTVYGCVGGEGESGGVGIVG